MTNDEDPTPEQYEAVLRDIYETAANPGDDPAAAFARIMRLARLEDVDAPGNRECGAEGA